KKNIVSPTATAPRSTAKANPLAVFGTRTGLTPGQIRNQYGFGNLADQTYANRGAGQAIAVVIPYDVNQVRASVNTFATEFSLPQVDTNNLQIINAAGVTPPQDPDPNNGWETEACLNLEWVHAIAPQAQLYLILANSDLFTDMFVGVDRAVDTLVSRHGGGTVLMTFGSQNGELNSGLQAYLDQSFTRRAARDVTFVTGSGDVPGTVSYPSTSPYVVSVGGTSLERDTLGDLTGNETGWSNSGGGLSSVYTTAPGFQTGTTVGGVQVARRATPDLSFNADPASGYALYVAEGFGDIDQDGTADSGWLPGGAGGTSAAAPIAAGMIALANEVRLASGRGYLGEGFNDAIYDLNRVYPGFYFNDITTGTSGANSAATGYDLVTGNGSPRAGLLIDRLASAATRSLNSTRVEWFGEFKEAINKVGVISTPGGGFVNGTGSIAGNNQLSMTLTPRYDLTPQAPVSQAGGNAAGGSGTTTANNIIPTQIVVDQFTPVTLLRLDNNTVTGTARVNVTIALAPLSLPSPSSPDDSAGTGGTTGGTGTTPTPSPIPGFFVAGVDDSVPPNVNGEIRTWQIDLIFSGQVYRDSKGRERIKGTFINRFSLYNPGGEPVEGLEPIFRGDFKA
ncbi:MAG TPA: S53 family peptidase, partial [Humisphaera sp.]